MAVEAAVRVVDGIQDADERAEALELPYDITAYGADFPVDALVDRLNNGDIVIPTFDPETAGDYGVAGFQRGFVWKKLQCDRFVESILLNLPVPGIFLVLQPNGKYLVLDGQQRLRTLQAFKRGILFNATFSLENVSAQLEDQTYESLDADSRRRLNNGIIHATIVKQDPTRGNENAVYALFERLNTGGTNLEPQEIRVALYQGSLLRLLRVLNRSTPWQQLLAVRLKSLKDQELILRFFAMLHRSERYQSPLKQFLNDFMSDHRELTDDTMAQWEAEFQSVVSTLRDALGPRTFRLTSAPNAAILESVMVGVARRLRQRHIDDLASLRNAYDSLLADDEYRLAISRGTASEDRVRVRLDKATAAFQDIY